MSRRKKPDPDGPGPRPAEIIGINSKRCYLCKQDRVRLLLRPHLPDSRDVWMIQCPHCDRAR